MKVFVIILAIAALFFALFDSCEQVEHPNVIIRNNYYDGILDIRHYDPYVRIIYEEMLLGTVLSFDLEQGRYLIRLRVKCQTDQVFDVTFDTDYKFCEFEFK